MVVRTSMTILYQHWVMAVVSCRRSISVVVLSSQTSVYQHWVMEEVEEKEEEEEEDAADE